MLADIETLNQAAHQEIYDVTAFSFGAYPFLRDKYVLLDCGASFGEGYGPIVVSQHPMKREDLRKMPDRRAGAANLRVSGVDASTSRTLNRWSWPSITFWTR